MNELVLPFKVNAKIGKTNIKYPLASITIKAKYKTSLAIGLFWLSFKIFFMGIRKIID